MKIKTYKEIAEDVMSNMKSKHQMLPLIKTGKYILTILSHDDILQSEIKETIEALTDEYLSR